MKGLPQINRFLTALCSYAIPVLFVVFSSCEKDTLDNGIEGTDAFLSASLLTTQPYENCETQCIAEGSETYYFITDSFSESNGQQRTISYKAYNTETHFVVEATYDLNNANTEAQIEISIDGNVESFTDVPQESTVSSSFELPAEWMGCDNIDFSIIANFNNGQANQNSQNSRRGNVQNNSVNAAAQNDLESGDLSYSLIPVCPPCEESFTWEDNQDGSYTFRYMSTESLEDAEVKFTCPHIKGSEALVKGYEALDGKIYDVNPG
ncbi:MAG: hypothetical protein P8Z38_06795, partial [Robiginitalea sp.]